MLPLARPVVCGDSLIDAQGGFVLLSELHRKGGGRMTSSEGSSWGYQRPGEVAET